MKIQAYKNFEIVANHVAGADPNQLGLTVQVASPAGDTHPVQVSAPADLWRRIRRLHRRSLKVDEIVQLGETLGELLLPGDVRFLLRSSMNRLGPEQGLRLRLRLDPVLAGIPWEYLYLPLAAGEKDITGFLALDPRLSLVRHEAVPTPVEPATRPRRLLVAMASPDSPDFPPLDLARERAILEQVLRSVPDVSATYLEHATLQGLEAALRDGADIFHYAGHADFLQTGLGSQLGAITGEGALVLESPTGPQFVPAEQLGVNLRARGVQLAVFGACETGRRDQENVWSGVAPALMQVGIPAVVAMQTTIRDEAAIAFSRNLYQGLYQGLASGLILDQAVAAGRLGIFNLSQGYKDDPDLGGYWQDWGAPVLYSRVQEDFTLTAISDPVEREAAAGDLLKMMSAMQDELRLLKEALEAMARRPTRTIHTGGGTYIEGGVNTRGGDFISRDKIVKGDEVHGEKVSGDKITIGDVGPGSAVAAGRGAQAGVSSGLTGAELERLFSPLISIVQESPEGSRAAALKTAAALKDEAAKGDQADDSRMAKLIDRLAELVPEAVGAVVSIFASPILGGIAGPVTKFVLDKIQGK